MAKKVESRIFNIAVVGLSGTEREKGATGVGKSHLCNRFTRPLADEYYQDHISVLSQTDFSGRVVNNDHFLYWGEVMKTTDEGVDLTFNVIEQTEFIDDASFQPFKGGKTEPYVKRCSATKIQSAEKLMYICKNQLGIEHEYEQKLLPDGKLNIDGFVVVFDVSQVPNRPVERQVEFLALLLNNVTRTKKPCVLVTTKNDEAVEYYMREAEKLVNRKDYRGAIQVVETSAVENVNVELAFILLVQMVDKSKGRTKNVPYHDAALRWKEVLEVATNAYHRLLVAQVYDYKNTWNAASKAFAQNSDFGHYVDLMGRDSALKLFRRHIAKLREQHIHLKKQSFIRDLPNVLQELLSDLESLGDRNWDTCQWFLHEHPDFDKYFVDLGEGMRWQDSEYVDSIDHRVPFDLLELSDAETCFRNHVNALQAEQKRLDMQKQFKQLLETTAQVTPGKPFADVAIFFMGRECYESLPDCDRREIYDYHQKEITERAKLAFQELLLEHSDLFARFTNMEPHAVPLTQEDLKEIQEPLVPDTRYRMLNRLDQHRTGMILQHLGFICCPKPENCPSAPMCWDISVNKVLASRAHRPTSWTTNNQFLLEPQNSQLNLIFLGIDRLADELINEIRAQCIDDEYTIDDTIYSLDYRPIDGDVSRPQNAFRTTDFLPHGCFCIYNSLSSLEYIQDSLQKTLLANVDREDGLPFQGLPIVVVFACDLNYNEKDFMLLREEGQHLSDSLQCPFIDNLPDEFHHPGQRFSEDQVATALRALVESIRYRAGFVNPYQGLSESIEPDIRITFCMMCGDPYPAELVLGPLLRHQCCYIGSENCITLETFLGDSKRKVEVLVTSYHAAGPLRDELCHGFVLVYSAKRKASLAVLKSFTGGMGPNVPLLIVAVTESGGAFAFFNNEYSQFLITDGNNLADQLGARFLTTSTNFQEQTATYTPFFKEAWDRKQEVEGLYRLRMADMEPLPHQLQVALVSPLEKRPSGSIPVAIPKIPSKSDQNGNAGDYDNLALNPHEDGQYSADEAELPSPSYDGSESLEMYSSVDDSLLYTDVRPVNDRDQLIRPSQLRQRRSMYAEGWVDNNLNENDKEGWADSVIYETYGRKDQPQPGKPVKPPLKPKPGKLDLRNFGQVTDAIQKWTVRDTKPGTHSTVQYSRMKAAPLATPESIEIGSDYAQVKDAIPSQTLPLYVSAGDYALVQDALPPGHMRRMKSSVRKNASWQATSKGLMVRPEHMGSSMEEEGLYEIVSPKDPLIRAPGQLLTPDDTGEVGEPTEVGGWPGVKKKIKSFSGTEKAAITMEDKQRKKEEKKAKDDEKRRMKEEEKAKLRQEKQDKRQRKKTNSTKSCGSTSQGLVGRELDEYVQTEDRLVPSFLEMCITFIEEEGLTSEGLYRVPGNKAHVDLLMQKFEEDPSVNPNDLEIPVNAVATALKTFFQELPTPLVPSSDYEDLLEAASLGEQSARLVAIRDVIDRLPLVNQEVLKFFFVHLHKVSQHSRETSMDSNNLAKCFWPTILRPDFTTFETMAQASKILEEAVWLMIEHYEFIFFANEEVTTV